MKKPCYLHVSELLILLVFSQAYSQSPTSPPHFKPERTLPLFIQDCYREADREPFEDSTCANGIFIIRFRLDASAQLTEVQYSVTAVKPLAEKIINCLKNTNGKWVPAMNGTVAVQSDYFVLPVLYVLAYPCFSRKKKENLYLDFWDLHRFEGPAGFSHQDIYKGADVLHRNETWFQTLYVGTSPPPYNCYPEIKKP